MAQEVKRLVHQPEGRWFAPSADRRMCKTALEIGNIKAKSAFSDRAIEVKIDPFTALRHWLRYKQNKAVCVGDVIAHAQRHR